MIYQKCVIIIFHIWIFDEMRDSCNVSKIGLIYSALSKSACGGGVAPIFTMPLPQHTGALSQYKDNLS